MKRILAIAGTLALAVGLAGGLASSAQARPVPVRSTVIYDAPAQTGGWSSPSVRPKSVTLDGWGNVVVLTASWKHWGQTTAKSYGTLLVNTCSPECASGNNDYYAATLVLYRPEWHGSTRYFSRMELSYHHGSQHAYVYSFNGHYWTGGPS